MRVVVESEKPVNAKLIAQRLNALAGRGPKGLPPRVNNRTDTEPLTPTEHNLPRDVGYDPRHMVTGSGNGPEM